MTTAMILSAGRGKRMRPISDRVPKPLITINDVPLIVYHLEKLAKAGIREVVINLDYMGDKIQRMLGNGQAFGVQIAYAWEKEGALGTAGGIAHALPLLGRDRFIVINCDIWSDFDYAQLLSKQLNVLAHLILAANPEHHPEGDFGLSQGGHLTLDHVNGVKYTYSGVGVYHPDCFDACPPGFYGLGRLLKHHLSDGTALGGEYFTGTWHDIGTPDRLKALRQCLKDNKN